MFSSHSAQPIAMRYALAACLLFLAFLSLSANRLHAQDYGLGTLNAFEANSNTQIDRIPSGENFDLIFGLHVGGSSVNPEPHPAGTLTFESGDADFVSILGQPQFSFPNFQCTGGTGGTPLTCTWDGFTGTAFTAVFGIRVQAPFVSEETPLSITGTVSPYDPNLAGIGVLETQDIDLTVEPGEMPATDLQTLIVAPTEVGTNAMYTYDVTIRNNGPNASGTFTISTNVAGEVISGSHGACAVQSTVNLQCPGLGPLASGESITITVTAQAGANTGNATLAARWINDALDDTAPGNDIAFHQLTIVEAEDEADLSLECEQEGNKQGEVIGVDEEITVICVFSNLSQTTATNVVFNTTFEGTDVVPTSLTADGNSTCEPAFCDIPLLAMNEIVTVQSSWQATQPGDLTATYAVAGETPDPAPGNNTFTFTFTVEQKLPDLNVEIIGPDQGVLELVAPVSPFPFLARYPFTVKAQNLPDARATSENSETIVNLPNSLLGALQVVDVPSPCTFTGGLFPTVRCVNGVLAPGDDIQFGLTVEFEVSGETSHVAFEQEITATVRPLSPNDDEDFSNHFATQAFTLAPPIEFVFSDPVRTVPSGVVLVNGIEVTNNTEVEQEVTLTVSSSDDAIVDIMEVATEDGACSYDEEKIEFFCGIPLVPGATETIEVTAKAKSEGEAKLTVKNPETGQQAESAITVTPQIPLPDLYVLAQPFTEFGGRGDPYVAPEEEYYFDVTVGNTGDADSQNSVLTVTLEEGTVLDPLPAGCAIDPLQSTVFIDCLVGALPVSAQRSYIFYIRAPEEMADDRLIGHEAEIIPLIPVLDKNVRNHKAEALTLITTRNLAVNRRSPERSHINEDFALVFDITNFADSFAEDIRLALEGDAGFMIVDDLGDTGVTTDIDGAMATQMLAEIPGNSSVQMGVLGLYTTAGPHEITATVTVLGVEVHTETITIEVLDGQPGCIVTKTLASDDATPPVRDLIHYHITVSSSEAIENVVLTDDLPAGLRIPTNRDGLPRFPPPPDCRYIPDLFLGESLKCQFPLAAGETRDFFFAVQSTRSGTITNLAEACGTSDVETVEPQDIRLEFINPSDEIFGTERIVVALGDAFNIEASITNIGPSDTAPDVRAFFELIRHPRIAFQSSLRCDLVDAAAFCDNLGSLAVGESTQVTIIARALRQGRVNMMGETFTGDGRDDIDFLFVDVLSREGFFEIANTRFGEGSNKQADAVDVYLDSVRVADDLAPGSALPFLPLLLSAVAPRIDIVASAAPDNSAPLATFTPDLSYDTADGPVLSTNTLLLLADTPGDTLGLIVKRNAQRQAADPTRADVFFIHASPDAPPLLVQIQGVQENPAPLAFGETSEYQSVEPGVYMVDVTDASTGTFLNTQRLDLTASAGQAVALALTGRLADGTFTLDAFDGQGTDVPSPTEDADGLPTPFMLHGNYPNPFNPTTTLRFDLPEPADIRAEVFDVLGRRVLTLAAGRMPAGAARTLSLDATVLSSGIYFYRLTAEGAVHTHTAAGRFVLLK